MISLLGICALRSLCTFLCGNKEIISRVRLRMFILILVKNTVFRECNLVYWSRSMDSALPLNFSNVEWLKAKLRKITEILEFI